MNAPPRLVSDYIAREHLQDEQTPRLPEQMLRDFVKTFFDRRQDFLSVTAQRCTPLYLFEPEILHHRARRFQNAFRQYFSSTGFYYAVKSNNYSGIARRLVQTGFGLDVSSGLELALAINLGAQDIIFSGPGKTRTELKLAIQESDRLVVLVDSFQELAVLAQLAAPSAKTVRIGVRLTTNPEGLWRKFGILPAALPQFIQEVRKCTNLVFQGIQFHTSWNLDPQAQVEFLSILGPLLSSMPASVRAQISFLDIGGGYWPEQGEWLQPAGTVSGKLRQALQSCPSDNQNHYWMKALPIEDYAAQLSRAIATSIHPLLPDCRICFEPGRWLCNDVMHLLVAVVDKKGEDLVITDGGTNAVGWERFETDYFPVLNLSRPALTERACNVLGSLCTPHDVWGYNYWGEDIEIGDLLLIPNQGAYTYSLRQNFIKPLPEVATVQGDSSLQANVAVQRPEETW